MTTNLKPAIIKLGNTLPSLSAHRGDFEVWVLAGMGMRREDVIIVDPRNGETLPDMEEISGAVLTGSHAMVTERSEWSEHTADWLRRATFKGVPILGICYGHQLLAHALGGEVGYNPLGAEFGTVRAQLERTAQTDWLLGSFGDAVKVQTSHSQSVLKLPEGARNLASSNRDPHLAFVVRERAWGVQFHPEFDVEIVRAYVRAHQDELSEQGQNPDALIKACQPTPAGTEILRRFAQLIAGSESIA